MTLYYSLSYFRHHRSNYEIPACGVNQGVFFTNFMPSMIRAMCAVWGGWTKIIHHDDRVMEVPYFKVLKRLEDAGVLRLRYMGPAETLTGSMLWRIDPIFDTQADWVVCRDIDSLPMHRDRKMVELAMSKGAAVHAIHDSESHSGPLMGGTSAFNAALVRKGLATPCVTSEEFRAVHGIGLDFDKHGADQTFLNREIWPKFQKQTIIHTRRPNLQYACMRAYPTIEPETPLDKVVRHIGAGYEVPKAMEILNALEYSEKRIIEECEK